MISIIAVAVLPAVVAQSITLSDLLPDPTDCVGTPVTMSSCSTYFSKYTACFENTNPNSQASCYCPQTVLDELAGYGGPIDFVAPFTDCNAAAIKSFGIVMQLPMSTLCSPALMASIMSGRLYARRPSASSATRLRRLLSTQPSQLPIKPSATKSYQTAIA